MQTYRFPPLTPGPGDKALEGVLRHIAVPPDVLGEAKKRRETVRRAARQHPAARGTWASGSIAHGTHNSPLGDADCGVMVDRRSEEFRAYGPDADGIGLGPDGFITSFAKLVLPQVRAAGYPRAEVDLTGNRSIKFLFNDTVDFGQLGAVDPYVDLIVGLDRREKPGIWIPNRKKNGWDAAHPEKHTELMTRDPQEMVVHRAHLVRLGKRAIKRDGVEPRIAAMCSWNFSAQALTHGEARGPLASALAQLLEDASLSIRRALTPDPAGVADPIALPAGMSNLESAARLHAMSEIVKAAPTATSLAEARRILSGLFGIEIDEIRAREKAIVHRSPLNPALESGDAAKVGAALGVPAMEKKTRSHGGVRCP